MDSLARARELCGCVTCRSGKRIEECVRAKRIAAAIDEARLEEAKWWSVRHFGDTPTFAVYVSVEGEMAERIAELEASLRERGKV